MVRDSESPLDQAHLAMLQTKQLITNNVLWKRKEQLAKWEMSETNRVPSIRKAVKDSKVHFTEADVFLSACLSGDLDEVQTLLDNGADINTCTVDGLTALHQAVIDGKPEMVQFLAEHGANLNAQDNEGWTPLHAAACCGNVDLVEYLCSEGADLSITNSDKELALDLAEEDDCRVALEQEHRRKGVDPDECRNREMVTMKRDAEEWLRDGEYRDRPHSRTGASALHVAASKGYAEVLRLLLRAGADVNCRDRDGWTPLHAAAHWGERESATLLVQHGASFSELTNSGESVIDVADKDVVEYLEALQEKERTRLASNNSVNVLVQANVPLRSAKVGSTPSILRLSTEEKLKKTKLDEQDENKELRDGHYSFIIEEKSPSPSVEARIPIPRSKREVSETPSEQERETKSPSLTTSSEEKSSPSVSESRSESEEKNCENSKNPTDAEQDQNSQAEVIETANDLPSEELNTESSSIISSPKAANRVIANETISRSPSIDSTSSVGTARPGWLFEGRRAFQRDSSSPSSASPVESSTVKKNSLPVQRCASTSSALPWMALYRNPSGGPTHPAFAQFQSAVRQSASATVNKQPLPHPAPPAASAINVQLNPARTSLSTPPTEPNMPKESEAERRSKAKRQRDSRRSTQGVTREQLRAASTAVRREDKENDLQWNSTVLKDSSPTVQESSPVGDAVSSSSDTPSLVAKDDDSQSCTHSVTSSIANVRRRSQVPRNARRGTGPVSMEDVQSAFGAMGVSQKTAVYEESTSSSSSSVTAATHPNMLTASTSAPSGSAITRVVVSMRDRPIPSAQTSASQPSTLVSSRSSSTSTRPGSVSGLAKTASQDAVDYKTLYEKEVAENERLRRKIEELSSQEKNVTANGSSSSLLRRGLGRLGSPSVSKSTSSSSIDDQERRSYERRIAEMEYEIKQLEHLRADNQKLKEENGALIRVISKLSK